MRSLRTLQDVYLGRDYNSRSILEERDETLWYCSLEGDGEAFGLLFNRHRERVFRHACRLTQSREDAEDVVGSAFLELWRRRTQVRLVSGSMLPWLLVTTTNLCRNSRRGTRRYRQMLERLPREGKAPDVAEAALAAGVDTRLGTEIRALKKTDAQLIALVALEGYSINEAAELLELSQASTRARLHRARARLRQRLGDQVLREDPDDQGDNK